MTTVTIKVSNKKYAQLLCEMLNTMKFVKEVGIEEELEDLGLSKMLKKVDRTKKVSKESSMKKLKA